MEIVLTDNYEAVNGVAMGHLYYWVSIQTGKWPFMVGGWLATPLIHPLNHILPTKLASEPAVDKSYW